MADKMHTLIIGGQEVQVPAWASEQTMGQVASYMSQTARTDATFAKMMKKVGGDLGELTKEIEGLVGATVHDIKADDKSDTEQEKFTKKLVKGSNKLDGLMGFFGKHEKPLTAMTSGLSSLVKGAKNSSGGMKMLEGMMNSASGGMNMLGAGLNVAVDAFLAYAGWNAAKLEQFSEVQGKLINSGILMQGGAEAYDTLRKGIQDTGNTYLHLSTTLDQFSDGLLGLGDNVSEGALRFSKFYQQLDNSVESLGDLGMSSKDMLSAYGEFISYQRRTGALQKNLNTSAAQMNQSFIGMQIESGAIASLSSLSRQEAMRAQMQGVNDFGNAALRSLEAQGLTEQADLQKSIMQSLGIVATKSPEVQQLLDAYNISAFKAIGNPEEFDMSAAIESFSPGLEAQMKFLGVDLVQGLEDMTKAGIAPAEGILSYVLKQINDADQSKLAAAATAGDTWATALLSMQAAFSEVNRDLGGLSDAEAFAKAKLQQEKDMVEAGKTVKAMNEMTERFISVQEALTMDMATIANQFDNLEQMLMWSKKKFDSMMALVGYDGDVNDFGGIGGNPAEVFEALAGVIPDIVARETYVPVKDHNRSTPNAEVEGESSTASIITQMRDNDGVLTTQMLESANLEYVRNLDGAAAYLNSVQSGLAERSLAAMIDYDKQMKEFIQANPDGPVEYLTVTGGRTNDTTPGNKEGGINDLGATINFVLSDSDNNPKMEADAYTGDSMFAQVLDAVGLDNRINPESGLRDIQGNNNGTVTVKGFNQNANRNFLGFGDDLTNDNIGNSDANTGVNIAGPVTPTRRYGGSVDAGQPYIVGDELGMQTAEVFVPGQSGSILSNNEFKRSIQETVGPAIDTSFAEMIKDIQSNLTKTQEPAIMNNNQDLSDLVASKKSAIETVKALQQIVRRYNINEKDKINTRMLNSR
jgi:hypothetical protein